MKVTRLIVLALFSSLSLFSCKKEKEASQSRVVKYEVSGNYTGKLNVVYTNASGNAETATAVTLPWSKELTLQNSVQAIAFTSNTTSTSTLGVAGQTATAKIRVGGNEKATQSKTADTNGHIQFGSLTFTY